MIFIIAMIVGFVVGCLLAPKELGFDIDEPSRSPSETRS